MAASKKRKKFSIILCKTTFDGQTLKIQGRVTLVTLFLILMTIAIAAIVIWLQMPWVIKISASIGGLITLYGVLDTIASRCSLTYNIATQQLQLIRSNLFAKVSHNGNGTGKLFVKKRYSSRSDHGDIPYYTVVLTAVLEDAIVQFPLETFDIPEDRIEDAIAKWQNLLRLNP